MAVIRLVSRFLAACILVGVLANVAELASGSPPNILIITVDDMSCDSVGAYGCRLGDTTPNMDRLAKTSMRFRYAHVQVGNCMPSRNVMWSGRYPHNNGVEGFYPNAEPEFPVLCDLAKSAGYFTAIRHKVSHSTPYSPYAWDLVLDDVQPKPHVKDPISYGDSTRQGIAAATQAGKQFCLMINVADPHKPFYTQVKSGEDPHVPSRVFSGDEVPVPGFLPDDSVVRNELALYYSSVRRADDAVGEILKALADSGQESSTLVMFLADHGMPLPFAKTQLYHHSTHTPLMVRLPGVTKPDSEDDQHMVSAVDFLPTLLDIAEVEHPKGLDGRTFEPLLSGQSQTGRDFVIKVYNENSGAKRNPMRGIQSREYLYLFNPWSNGTRKMATATNGTETYRRMQQLAKTDSQVARRLNLADFRTVEELYDVQSDPDCLVNLIASPEHQAALRQLREQLHQQLTTSGDPIASILLDLDAAKMEQYVAARQLEADARRAARRKKPIKNVNRVKGIIKLAPRNIDASDPRDVTVTVNHTLPAHFGKQKLHVTLKDSQRRRIQRQVVEISGKGKAVIAFSLPSNNSPIASVAAFVGEEYTSNVEHIQTSVK